MDFIDRFKKNPVGTIYEPSKDITRFNDITIKVLEHQGYVKKTQKKSRTVWKKIKSLPRKYNYEEAMDIYYYDLEHAAS